MRIGRRLYLQFAVAIMPLALLVVWLALSRNDLPQRVNAALKAYDLSLESANAYRDFMSGVADALDTGRIASGAIASLKRAQDSATRLAEVSPADAPLPARVAAIARALAANPSLDVILPLKDEAQAVRVALVASSEAKRAALSQLVEAEESTARRKQDLVIAAAIGSLLVMAFTVVVLSRLVHGITKPLAEAVGVANAIAGGRLDNRIVVRGNDEIAQLQSAMKAMQDHLSAIVRSVRQASQSVAEASTTVSEETRDLSHRSEEQAASLEEAAASMEQLASAVRESSGNATEADKLARGVAGAAVGGGDSVKRVVETMRGITESSRKIGDIVGVIDSIAFQTNILALNAAVEAAHAGDQGRGFAVVATEVRILAQRAATAATEIKALIAESVRRIDGGGHDVEVAGNSIDALVDDVKKVSALMSEIAAASTQQEQGIRQVSLSVTDMDRVVQQNTVAVQRSAAQGEMLRRDAHHLEEAMSRFTLPSEAEEDARPSTGSIARASPSKRLGST